MIGYIYQECTNPPKAGKEHQTDVLDKVLSGHDYGRHWFSHLKDDRGN